MDDKYVQLSITICALGLVITLIGLFPGIAGLEAAAGIGVLQVLVILLGFSLLFGGAYLFAGKTLYPGMPHTLAQDIGVRLTLTGLLIAAAAGLADVLGFGSHPPTPQSRPLLGNWQAAAFIGGFLLASSGVVIFALMGPSQPEEEATASPETSPSGADDLPPEID